MEDQDENNKIVKEANLKKLLMEKAMLKAKKKLRKK